MNINMAGVASGINPDLVGIHARYKESASWIKSSECRLFLVEATDYLRHNPFHSELVAHYLMGKIHANRLPPALQNFAGDWHTREIRAELYTVLSTHRFFLVETLGKTSRKLEFLRDKSLDVWMNRSEAEMLAGDPRDLLAILYTDHLNSEQAMHKRVDLTQRLLTCYARDETRAFPGFDAALLSFLRKKPVGVFDALRGLVEQNPATEGLSPSRIERLFQAVLDQPERGHAGLEPSTVLAACIDILFLKTGGPRHPWSENYRPLVLKAAMELVSRTKITETACLRFLAQAFNRGDILAEHVAQDMNFYVQLFNGAQCPALEFFLRNKACVLRMNAGDPVQMARHLQQLGLVLPPSPDELHDKVLETLGHALASSEISANDRTQRAMANALRHGTYVAEVKSIIDAEVEEVCRNLGVALTPEELSSISELLFEQGDEAVARVRLKQSLSEVGDLSSDAVNLLASCLANKGRHMATKKWLSHEFRCSDPDGVDRIYAVFRQFQNWRAKWEAQLDSAVQGIAGRLADLDDAMYEGCSAPVFAHCVLATLPYRSLDQLNAILERPGLHEDFKRVLQKACDSLSGYQDAADASRVMFVGYTQTGGEPGEPRFMRVADLSLLHPRAVDGNSVGQFFLRSGANDRPIGLDDLPEMALPTYLWNALSGELRHRPAIETDLQQFMLSLVASRGRELSVEQRDLLNGAIGQVCSPWLEFSSNVSTKVGLRALLDDEALEDTLAALNAHMRNSSNADLSREITSRHIDIPNVELIDQQVKAFCQASHAEEPLVYYMFGFLLARLSSSAGLGWEVGARAASTLGVSENQSLVGLRLLSAYCLSRCRASWPSVGVQADIDNAIHGLIRTSGCSAVLSLQLHGHNVPAGLEGLSEQTAALLPIHGRAPTGARPAELPVMGGDVLSRGFRPVDWDDGEPDTTALIRHVAHQARQPAIP